MHWLYKEKESEKKVGPISDLEMESLVRQGRIRPDTQVWNEEIGRWLPYEDVRPGGGNSFPRNSFGTPERAEPAAPDASRSVSFSLGGLKISKKIVVEKKVWTGPPGASAESFASPGQEASVKIKSSVSCLSATLNIIGLAATLWLIFFPNPYSPAAVVCTVIPAASLLGVFLAARFGGGGTMREAANTKRYQLIFAVFAPPTVLFFWTYNGFHVVSYAGVWVPAAVLGAVIAALIFILPIQTRMISFLSYKTAHAGAVLVLIISLLYGYEAILETNCLLDGSAPGIYTATVIDKRISYFISYNSLEPDRTDYYLKIGPWGPVADEREIKVKYAVFSRVKASGHAEIDLKKGALGIPWYKVKA